MYRLGTWAFGSQPVISIHSMTLFTRTLHLSMWIFYGGPQELAALPARCKKLG